MARHRGSVGRCLGDGGGFGYSKSSNIERRDKLFSEGEVLFFKIADGGSVRLVSDYITLWRRVERKPKIIREMSCRQEMMWIASWISSWTTKKKSTKTNNDLF